MPSPKRPVVKVSKDKLPKPPVVTRLVEAEHRNLWAAALEGEAATERAERLKMERLLVLSKIDPEGRVLALEKALIACGERLSKAETRHGEWLARVRERTGIQKEFTFDSETGVISEISSE
jgi:hypothetical protein